MCTPEMDTSTQHGDLIPQKVQTAETFRIGPIVPGFRCGLPIKTTSNINVHCRAMSCKCTGDCATSPSCGCRLLGRFCISAFHKERGGNN